MAYIKEVRAGNVRDRLIKEVQELHERMDEIQKALQSECTQAEYVHCAAIKSRMTYFITDMDRERRRKP